MELIFEKGYRSSMDGEVVPFLQKDRYSGRFCSDGDEGLYYERYGGRSAD